MAFFNYKVIAKVRARKLVGKTVNLQRGDQLNRTKRKSSGMLIGLVTGYFVTTIPYFIYVFVDVVLLKTNLALKCGNPDYKPVLVFNIASIYYTGSVVVNPIIIFYFNPDFRQELFRIFRFKRKEKLDNVVEVKTVETQN